MGLHVCEFAGEELFDAFDGDFLCFIDVYAPSIVASSWVSFGIFVGHDGAGSFKDGSRDDIFGCDEFDTFFLSLSFFVDEAMDIWVCGVDVVMKEAVSVVHGKTFGV